MYCTVLYCTVRVLSTAGSHAGGCASLHHDRLAEGVLSVGSGHEHGNVETVLYRIVLHCTVLYCIVLYCIALYCIGCLYR